MSPITIAIHFRLASKSGNVGPLNICSSTLYEFEIMLLFILTVSLRTNQNRFPCIFPGPFVCIGFHFDTAVVVPEAPKQIEVPRPSETVVAIDSALHNLSRLDEARTAEQQNKIQAQILEDAAGQLAASAVTALTAFVSKVEEEGKPVPVKDSKAPIQQTPVVPGSAQSASVTPDKKSTPTPQQPAVNLALLKWLEKLKTLIESYNRPDYNEEFYDRQYNVIKDHLNLLKGKNKCDLEAATLNGKSIQSMIDEQKALLPKTEAPAVTVRKI